MSEQPEPTEEEEPDGPVSREVYALNVLQRATTALNEALVQAKLDELGAVGCLHILDTLREQVVKLQMIDAGLTRHIYLTGEHGKIEVEGIGMVEVHRSRAKERWDHEELAVAVVDAHMVELEGELPDPLEVARWVMAECAPSYWRKTGLRQLGIDPAVYYSSEPGKPTVSLPKHQERTTARPAR